MLGSEVMIVSGWSFWATAGPLMPAIARPAEPASASTKRRVSMSLSPNFFVVRILGAQR